MSTTIRPTRSSIEALVRMQRAARAAGQTPPAMPAEWDLTGASLCGADLHGAVLRGAVLYTAVLCDASLYTADLRDTYLRGADLAGADLRHADLRGARITEGTVTSSVAGYDGGHYWHAMRTADGPVVLDYGGHRAMLDLWLGRSPNHWARLGRPTEHWAVGPAVAIAAAERLAAG